MSTKSDWIRAPFFGGCEYYATEPDRVVVGHYSPADPLQFESDCSCWKASNLPGRTFKTADEAMDASDAA